MNKLKVSNEVELTYYEFGKENAEIIIMSQFYYDTFKPWCEALGKKYHVNGIVMRHHGPIAEYADDGEINWSWQWGKDVCDFAREMGIDQFVYVGKCHGSVPGWYILDKHPEMLKAFACIGFAPRLPTETPPHPEMVRIRRLQLTDVRAFVCEMVRKPESVDKKVAEIQGVDIETIMTKYKYKYPLPQFKTADEIIAFYRGINVPMLALCGTEDVGWLHGGHENYVAMAPTINDIKLVTYSGERHFLEIDIPDKLADEVDYYIQRIGME